MGRTCPHGNPGEIEAVILSMLSGDAGGWVGSGVFGAGVPREERRALPCLSTNLPCGLGKHPFLSLSFSFVSHRASQSTAPAPGRPHICPDNDDRSLGASMWQLAYPPGAFLDWEELAKATKTCGIASLGRSLVQNLFANAVSKPAKAAGRGCSPA